MVSFLGTIIAVLIGGCLSSFQAAMKDKWENERNRKKLYREKLEKAYMASDREDWFIEINDHVPIMISYMLNHDAIIKDAKEHKEIPHKRSSKASAILKKNPIKEMKILLDIWHC